MKRILALDLGDKRIGVAISDTTGTIAQPIGFIERKNQQEVINSIKHYINAYRIEKIVIGFPRSLNGSIGPRAQLVLEFSERIKGEVKKDIILWDERFTTAIAEKTLIKGNVKRKIRKLLVDKIAATLILQSYLDYVAENYKNVPKKIEVKQ
jgi:putative Holliday junction resolvase